jgi:hypothetical protein
MSSSDHTFYCCDGGDGSTVKPWHLVDVSGGGARLRVGSPDEVPDSFTLVQKADVMRLWQCRVVWRSSSEVGIKFEIRENSP